MDAPISFVMARPFHHPSLHDVSIDDILRALADPARRDIVIKLLSCNGMSCREACQDTPASTVSHHHKVLRACGIIRSEKQGVEVINTVRKDDLDRYFPGLLDTILRHHQTPTSK